MDGDRAGSISLGSRCFGPDSSKQIKCQFYLGLRARTGHLRQAEEVVLSIGKSGRTIRLIRREDARLPICTFQGSIWLDELVILEIV